MRHAFVVTAFVGLLSSAALAGPLASDPFAIPGWKGTTFFDSALDPNLAPNAVKVNVDYAVYAPGAYGASGGVDPSGGTKYVYAYQLFSVGSNYSILTVGILPPSQADAGQPGSDATKPQLGGVAPLAALDLVSSMFYNWGSLPTNGTFSRVVLFTSSFPPTNVSSSVNASGSVVQLVLPSPIPEPASLALIALGLGSLVVRRRR